MYVGCFGEERSRALITVRVARGGGGGDRTPLLFLERVAALLVLASCLLVRLLLFFVLFWLLLLLFFSFFFCCVFAGCWANSCDLPLFFPVIHCSPFVSVWPMSAMDLAQKLHTSLGSFCVWFLLLHVPFSAVVRATVPR